jgi:glutaredoxin
MIRTCIVLALLLFTAAARADVDVYYFWRDGCPHCERATEFLTRLRAEQPDVRVQRFDVWGSNGEGELLARVASGLRVDQVAVPFIVVGDYVFIGYDDDANTGSQLAARIAACRAEPCPDRVAPILGEIDGQSEPRVSVMPRRGLPSTVTLPIIGEVATRDLSLPALTVLLAAVDGFNPCAMWTLVFLIGLLAGMPDRTRLWVLGGAFIAASAGVYFLFMAAWLNALLFFGMLVWIRVAVAIVALGGGAYYLREFWRDSAAVCAVTAPARRRRVLERLKSLALEQRFYVALTGIVLLAFAVNLIELLCSAGIPAVYTQVLALSNLPAWQYYGYLLLYVTIFMLDDLLVFFTAVKTLELTGMGTRYLRISHLIGGFVLVAIGVLLLLKPEWLMFG